MTVQLGGKEDAGVEEDIVTEARAQGKHIDAETELYYAMQAGTAQRIEKACTEAEAVGVDEEVNLATYIMQRNDRNKRFERFMNVLFC